MPDRRHLHRGRLTPETPFASRRRPGCPAVPHDRHHRPPRARFAPSPTGYFHVGSARAALYNWLFVRQHGGTFVLRIEDTDEVRNRPEWTDGIIAALDWLGMAPDEGPYFQSQQDAAHDAAIEALWASGALYACGCTREEIDDPDQGPGGGRRSDPGLRRAIAATSGCPGARGGRCASARRTRAWSRCTTWCAVTSSSRSGRWRTSSA